MEHRRPVYVVTTCQKTCLMVVHDSLQLTFASALAILVLLADIISLYTNIGWLLLKEPVDAFMLIGTVIIIGSVALVNTSKLKRIHSGASESDLSAVNVAGD